MKFLTRLSRHMAKAVPYGPVLDELSKQPIPLDATDLPAGVARDLEHGRQPPYVTARLLLAEVDVSAYGGGGDEYLAGFFHERLGLMGGLGRMAAGGRQTCHGTVQ
jgi:hypothetical protein